MKIKKNVFVERIDSRIVIQMDKNIMIKDQEEIKDTESDEKANHVEDIVDREDILVIKGCVRNSVYYPSCLNSSGLLYL